MRWSVENGALVPESIAITGGRAVFADNSWATNYYITDHLGSVRAVTDAQGEVLDTFDYMPYGSEISSTSSTTTDYRFTGKERQSMVNNSIYDSFARFQNTYGRFMSIDPKAENFYHISPYTILQEIKTKITMLKRYYIRNLKSPFHQIVPNLHYKL